MENNDFPYVGHRISPAYSCTLIGRPCARGCWTQVSRRRAHLVRCESVADFQEKGERARVSRSQLLAWAPPVNQDTYLPQTGACRSHFTLLALHAVQVRRCWLTKATKGGFSWPCMICWVQRLGSCLPIPGKYRRGSQKRRPVRRQTLQSLVFK